MKRACLSLQNKSGNNSLERNPIRTKGKDKGKGTWIYIAP